jgi:DNA-binding transcriptional LysR family regulator
LPDGFREQHLFEDGHRVVVRKNHPVIKKRMDLKAYLGVEHVLVSLGGDLEGIVDEALTKLGKRRRLVAGLPFFLPALSTVARTDMVATIPSRLATVFAEFFGLNVFQPPIQLPTYGASAIWHERNDNNELIRWMLERVIAVLSLRECGGDG